MEAHLQTLLNEVHDWGRAHDERVGVHVKKMLNLKPETAQLLSVLVRASRRQRLLELGTSNGYSTMWLAWSVAAFGGRVVSVDHNAEKLTLADANLRRAGLRENVELRHGDAADVVRTLAGPFDFVLFDSVQMRPYEPLKLLLPKLADDVLVLADNVLSHPQEMAPYLSLIASQPGFEHTVVPTGKGLSVAHRSGTPETRNVDS